MLLSLQLPLKRFRTDGPFNRNGTHLTTVTPEHLYLHGQPTPPSPSQAPFRVGFLIDHPLIEYHLYPLDNY